MARVLHLPRMPGQLANRRNICWLLRIRIERESLRNLPYADLSIIRPRCYNTIIERVPGRCQQYSGALVLTPYQSVSNTGPVCPRNSGICSGNRPFSFTGITAKAPPPLASQLTERYSGLAWPTSVSPMFHQVCGSYLDQIRVPGIATDM